MKLLRFAIILLLPLPLSASETGSWASGSWASGSWANGSWASSETPEPSTVAVPNVVGEASFAAADAILEAALLDGGTETEVCSAATNNSIVSQSPAAGTLVAEDTLVNLRSSNGVACPPSGGAEIILQRRRR